MIVTLAVTGLWSRERRRLLAEAALREREAQLRQSQKLDAVGRLAGGLAHDINNYLAAIISQCEVAKLKPGDASNPAQSYDAVISTAFKAGALIRRLLAFSRRESVQPRVVNLNHVVKDVEMMVRGLIGEDVHFETNLREDLWNVKIDPSQVEQVIVNLVVNSREAMPTGGQVTIRTANHRLDGDLSEAAADVEAGDYVVLEVSDTGAGIPPEIRDKIFDPFVTTKDKATSSGLGLATVYGIVKQSRGSIRVESIVGKGTTFEIYLPRTREEEPQARGATPSTKSAVGGSQRILLVEDNEELRTSTREALEVLGHSIVAASNGEEALDIFDEGVDLVVTDVVMPGMNGREVLERLRERKADLPVIFMSGYTDDVILRHGIGEDEVDFVPKPFSVDTLAAKIRDVLQRSLETTKERAVEDSGRPPAGTVLVIDDEDLLRRALKQWLETHSFKVLTASDGLEGVELFEAHSEEIGCILLDIHVPRLSGDEAFREFRRIRNQVPILLASGSDGEDVARLLVTDDSITGFLQKPFDLRMLTNTLRTVLRTGTVPELKSAKHG